MFVGASSHIAFRSNKYNHLMIWSINQIPNKRSICSIEGSRIFRIRISSFSFVYLEQFTTIDNTFIALRITGTPLKVQFCHKETVCHIMLILKTKSVSNHPLSDLHFINLSTIQTNCTASISTHLLKYFCTHSVHKSDFCDTTFKWL